MSNARGIFHFAIVSCFLEGLQTCINWCGCVYIMKQLGRAFYEPWKNLPSPIMFFQEYVMKQKKKELLVAMSNKNHKLLMRK